MARGRGSPCWPPVTNCGWSLSPCREVGTISYRSGPEWLERFGHRRADPDIPPDFCPDFLIETYLEKQVRQVHMCGICVSLVCIKEMLSG